MYMENNCTNWKPKYFAIQKYSISNFGQYVFDDNPTIIKEK